MKTAATLAIAAILAACGSDSNGPIDKPGDQFSGSWSGNAYYFPISADTLHFVFSASQTASAVTGTASYLAPYADALSFTGSSTPTTLNLVAYGIIGYGYTGTYVTSDSIVGTVDINGFQEDALSLKKSSGASDGTFNGTWSGFDAAVGLQFVLNAIQTEGAVTGSGTASTNGAVQQSRSFSGTSTPPTLIFAWASGGTLLTYAGTYVTSDSITGIPPHQWRRPGRVEPEEELGSARDHRAAAMAGNGTARIEGSSYCADVEDGCR